MSGPKDYGISYTIERLAEFRRQNEARQRARAEAVRQTLDAARRSAATRRRGDAVNRRSALDAELQQKAKASRDAVERANAAAAAQLVSQPVPPQGEAEAIETGSAEKRALVEGWAAALAADTAVGSFAAAERDAWTARTANATDANAEALAAEAQAIHNHAGEIQGRFETRNALLRDVIVSMQEIGYFVSDPQLANPADPAGPVILKATCGRETVTTTIDLSDAIKSVWDGQETEHCKSSFFDYMDAMKARGVDISPERADLRERPILKQLGANQLPRSDGRTEGQ